MPGPLWDDDVLTKLRALVASGQKPPYAVARADGSGILFDGQTAEFLLSTKPEPAEADLDRAFAGATTVRVVRAGFVVRGEPSVRPLLEVSGQAELAELRACLRIAASGSHCMCLGDYHLEIVGPDGVRARIGLHHGRSIRWDGKWRSDARLVDGRAHVDWLARHGLREPLERYEAELERQRERARELEAWHAAMPAGLEPLWPRIHAVVPVMVEPTALVEPALAALRATCPSEDAAVAALLAWYGHGARRWSGMPAYELLPEAALLTFPTATIRRALEAEDVDPRALVGAARLFCAWSFGKKRPTDRRLVTPELRERLRRAVDADGQAEPIETFRTVFARVDREDRSR